LRAKHLVSVVIMLTAGTLLAQDVIGSHDLSPAGTSPIKGSLSGSCFYCHAPHSGLNGKPGVAQTPLWNTQLSSVPSYTVYSSTTMVNRTNPSPSLGTDSTLCLSCHDGTVAGSPGALVAYGQIPLSGKMNSSDVLGTNLSTVHPFSFYLPLQPATDLVSSLTATPPSTADQTGAVRLIKGNVECTSCHNPHVQNIDPNSPNFLALDNTNSALCFACHNTQTPPGPGSGMGLTAAASTGSSTTNKANPIAGWSTSIHATATNKVARQAPVEFSSAVSFNAKQMSLGPYGTVARNACSSCHAPHNAQGEPLLPAPGDLACISCHNGTSNISPPAPNIYAEMTSPKIAHSIPSAEGNNVHSPAESAVLNHNRHATCVDCHNPHSSKQVVAFPPSPTLRPSQGRVVGISATDGVTELNPAVNQYENCLRCHGNSTGKQAKANSGYLPVRLVSGGDPLNMIPQFGTTAASRQPVMHDRSSPFPQPSLRPNMLNLDGRTQGRSMASRILCTDCHNSDDNREFGGNGPNGPHGSMFAHVLERRYEFSQAPVRGQFITNPFPNPSLGAEGGANGGPYALCAKCHDLANVLSDSSFSGHARHVKQDGFSCSVCHTAHGMGGQMATVSGERMVNFDVNVVAPNGTFPISYQRATNSCSLTCHGHAHNLAGTPATGQIRTK
jgi:predicted CXXCH cytochrome family protein